MAGLQRSEVSFRRQGSSGLVWDDKILSAELKKESDGRSNRPETKEEAAAEVAVASENPARVPGLKIERSRSNGGDRGFRTGKVSPAVEPPSPKVSACGFCGAFGKNDNTRRRPPKPGKRVM
ncbi:hypothetical protein F511_06035 [Dorcoceras hygrometricum]|uniref:MAPK kinase substrate protein n=1 Tax=Dorcoceras hygrometricum TaxID=472368 RepID=A0A2Z7B377_9LAMI|nr:hypothetical protein F511_06035 [Dorcoceras hygrometricum]